MAKNQQINETQANNDTVDDEIPVCGIIMPIAKTDGYPEKHWADVYSILCEVATLAGFNPNLVSFDDDVGIIHKRIVQNIYSNPIVICDISSRNANVMLELGMRLAFDKPTIIIKDDKTPYSFDIAAIEHVEYPSDLRYQLINDFKSRLRSKIIETYKRSNNDGDYTTFLKHFGTFKVAKIDEKEVSGGEYLAAEMKDLKLLVMNALNSSKAAAMYNERRHVKNSNEFASAEVTVPISKEFWRKIRGDVSFTKLQSDGIYINDLRQKNNDETVFNFEIRPETPPMSVVKSLIEDYLNKLNL